MSTMKRHDFILFSGNNEWSYDLITDQYQSHNKLNLKPELPNGEPSGSLNI